MVTTRAGARTTRLKVAHFGSIGLDLMSLVAEYLIKSQPLAWTATAALTNRELAEVIRPKIRALQLASTLRYVRSYGSFNMGRQALRTGNRLWCADMNNHRVCGFALPPKGSSPSSASTPVTIQGFEYPWFLASDPSARELFVAETSGSRISVYDATDGRKLRDWPMRRGDNLVWTQGIAVYSGELYAARPEERCITVHDTCSGAVVRRWRVDFDGHFGVSLCMIDGLIFVTRPDRASHGGVVVFMRDGTLYDDNFGGGRMERPTGVCALGDRFVCVARLANGRSPEVAIFSRDGKTLIRRHMLTRSSPIQGVNPVLISADDEFLYVNTVVSVAAIAHGAAALSH